MRRRLVLGLGAAAFAEALVACKREPPSEASTGAADAGAAPASTSEAPAGAIVRCAVIAGMMTTGLFPAVAGRFLKTTGLRAEVVVSGNKKMIVPAFRRGEADLVTMHAGDEMANLVADGLAEDAVPWARNDHVIVGPREDPARVRGLADAGEALRRIAAAKAPFVEHRGTGAAEVLRHVLDDAHVALSDEQTSRVPDGANQEEILAFASKKGAYTLVGRIPVQQGKLQGEGVEILVQGDARLLRPYLVAIAALSRTKRAPAGIAAARRLSLFLRSAPTQAFLSTFAASSFGGQAPFYPVVAP